MGRESGYACVCANLDDSWVWWGKNIYGWIEYYYTGLGTDDYEAAWYDAGLIARIGRGERFTLGRSYFDAQLRVELHPLVNGYTTPDRKHRRPFRGHPAPPGEECRPESAGHRRALSLLG
ncbi:MAG: hypothetical protein KGY56_09975 [Desulfobacterales bacterium]|nr:hypothetical protein [Desulfobacterales bacterium]